MDAGTGKLERLYQQYGVQGMRLYPIRDEDASWLSSHGQNSLWQTARQLRIPLTWFGYCYQIPLLETILQRFPQVKVIIDHLGEPRLSEGLDGDFRLLLQAARHPNLYVKATRIDGISDQPWPHRDVHPYIQAVFEAFGPQRMLGCTGFPENPQRGEAVGFRVIEEGLDFLSAEDKSWLLGRTADALYGRSSD